VKRSTKAYKMRFNAKVIKLCLLFLSDIILTGCLLCVLAFYHHVLPSEVMQDQSLNASATPMQDIIFRTPEPTSGSTNATIVPSGTIEPGATDVPPQPTATPDITMGGIFTTGEIIQTEESYKSKYVSVTCTTYKTDKIVYYVQDIYVRNMSCFKTAFAKDQYVSGYNTEKIVSFANSKNAIAAINGDQYGARKNGVVLRNGYLYRDKPFDDVCVLYNDGTMKIFTEDAFDGERELDNGAYQAWCFGPAMVLNGEAVTEFDSAIAGKNPRTAIGYYEPGHYCFVAVDGRQDHSEGIRFTDFAQLLENLGCNMAYNLDGGQTSQMVFMGKYYNSPYNGGRSVNDMIYICDIYE